MTHASARRRPSRTAAGVLAAAALTGLASLPAVAVAAEPDLGIGPLAPVTGAQPGSGVDVPFSVLNKGTEEAGKVWVTYSVTRGLDTAETYSNCLYSKEPAADEEPERQVAVCAIEQPLKPGVVYVPERPLGLQARDNALRDKVSMSVEASGQAPSDGEPGTGAPLELVERAPATEGDRASHDETYVSTEVASENTADFALAGAELRGEVGDKVTATVKFVNEGPAWVYRDLGQGAATVDVRIPPGTTVVKAHDFCSPVTPTHYSCGTSQSWVDEQRGETYPFVLRIDKAVEGATGKISFAGEARPFDGNAANDTAAIVIDADGGTTGGSSSGGSSTEGSSAAGSASTGGTAASGGSTSGGSDTASGGSASSSASGGSTTGGSDTQTTAGGLAATGSDSTLPVLGASAAALLAGGGIFYAVRRRAAAGN
ncbi:MULTISPECIES: peptidase [unclassified Streptomyces]|uniref:peptidase n=1 Tax=unclassified Streptomyces TaxID=2593676 RepID=UPI002E0DB58A|nr:peptidase [Streptomyces sp. NBC_01212]